MNAHVSCGAPCDLLATSRKAPAARLPLHTHRYSATASLRTSLQDIFHEFVEGELEGRPAAVQGPWVHGVGLTEGPQPREVGGPADTVYWPVSASSVRN